MAKRSTQQGGNRARKPSENGSATPMAGMPSSCPKRANKADCGITPEQRDNLSRHFDLGEVETAQAGVKALRILTQTPLDTYFRRGLLGDPETVGYDRWEAGDRLRQDFTLGNLLQRVTINPDSVGGCGGPENLSDAQIAARRRYVASLSKVDPYLRNVLVRVCCHDELASGVLGSDNLCVKSRSTVAMFLLRDGLDQMRRR